MGGVVLGFSIVAVIVLIGVVIAVVARDKAVAIHKGLVPLVYYVTNPCLMVVVVAGTDVRVVAGLYTPLALAIALLTALVFALICLVMKRSAADTAVGAMASSYANVGNIGVPVAIYAVGTTAPVVAFLLAQLLVLAPMYLLIFGVISRRAAKDEPGGSRLKMILSSVLNPTTVGVILGAVISLIGVNLPAVLWEPVTMVGEASIPLMLMIFGMVLVRSHPFAQRSRIPDSVLATLGKVVLMPAIALLLGGPVAGLEGTDLLGLVAMAALPTAQNVLLFGMHYRMPQTVAKDTIFASSILALPVTILAAAVIAV
ncbi:AEC family transporter [Nesterenkonia alkaliphila]|uniref:AEC family transporter n=1 Tax=Nesterenkonia alkaliphila TaxID=1463631 RepID=A0A7K1UEL5_9MICC|nr:AEC family transporter [Nesterenkonia alkaliphila]MVT24920.1 hypothetical protein [Nesterenkonia alkaliphila]GFZ86721.1 permease [Nesterenkonia alkaliphila]